MLYTYSIFDGEPSDGATVWPSHAGLRIEADGDAAAYEAARDALVDAAADLRGSDGYTLGQVLCASVWDAHGGHIGTARHRIARLVDVG